MWRAVVVASMLIVGGGVRHDGVSAQDGGDTLARIGAYVENYYGRTQSILAEQSVELQPVAADLTAQGFARRLRYELRVEWNPDSDTPATVRRELLAASGPPLGPPSQPDCLDPRSVSPEPLAFLLPARRHKFAFSAARPGRLDGRAVTVLDYKPVAPEPPVVDWRDQCATIDMPGRTGGRIWADAVTAEVLRVDEHVVGQVDIPAPVRDDRPFGPRWFTVERADTSIRYRRVSFTDPDETMLLPAEILSLSIIRNSGVPRLRTTERFTHYRRFVTGSRIVP